MALQLVEEMCCCFENKICLIKDASIVRKLSDEENQLLYRMMAIHFVVGDTILPPNKW